MPGFLIVAALPLVAILRVNADTTVLTVRDTAAHIATAERNTMSNPLRVLVSDERAFVSLWERMAGKGFNWPVRPNIDFTTSEVIVASLAEVGAVGPRIYLDTVKMHGAERIIAATHSPPESV